MNPLIFTHAIFTHTFKPTRPACVVLALFASILLTQQATAQAPETPTERSFIQLREALQRKNVADVDRLATEIPANYPLAAYAEYYRLKVRQPCARSPRTRVVGGGG